MQEQLIIEIISVVMDLEIGSRWCIIFNSGTESEKFIVEQNKKWMVN